MLIIEEEKNYVQGENSSSDLQYIESREANVATKTSCKISHLHNGKKMK